MSQLGFELTIPVFERANTVHASDHAANVIGTWSVTILFKYLNDYKICGYVQRT
jgi:hypothetical protein